MRTENINILIEEVNKRYNESKNNEEKQKLEKQYNELITRLTINDYLYYGYGIKTFLEQNYNYAKNIEIDRLKKLWEEQLICLGSEF